ncbi:hypothetical protein CANARDRAFT_27156 [[Candida] arabinofermentans NRRL YB-2248]|uniref:NADH dehydrogenase [ubiquinone] 1 beta subcomplex subunit 3 n=1 Tax=[Candida] arabinofermentans NRRL YB-2248 TaxID=983967 RepID=A0A1E4T4S7_9ASCO|nr:hypothetical protein CANARDRAFT_27156 [[Candida] arabinofermentans NRRL YB-2248]
MAVPHLNDPWKKRDAWRYEGHFHKSQRFRGLLPGLGWGFAAFLAVSVYEDYFMKKADHGHKEDASAHH